MDECHGDKKRVKDNKGKQLANIQALERNSVKHGPFNDENCSECHNSHGSNHFRLLKANYPDEFYAKYKEGTYSLCFECHKKERITTPKTTSLTGFRDKDMNLHYAHVVKPEFGRSCRSCHEDHATNKKHLIRQSVPYGSEGWALDLNYVETANGGNCSKTCHDIKRYNNQGQRPTDIANQYKQKVARQKELEKSSQKP